MLKRIAVVLLLLLAVGQQARSEDGEQSIKHAETKVEILVQKLDKAWKSSEIEKEQKAILAAAWTRTGEEHLVFSVHTFETLTGKKGADLSVGKRLDLAEAEFTKSYASISKTRKAKVQIIENADAKIKVGGKEQTARRLNLLIAFHDGDYQQIALLFVVAESKVVTAAASSDRGSKDSAQKFKKEASDLLKFSLK